MPKIGVGPRAILQCKSNAEHSRRVTESSKFAKQRELLDKIENIIENTSRMGLSFLILHINASKECATQEVVEASEAVNKALMDAGYTTLLLRHDPDISRYSKDGKAVEMDVRYSPSDNHAPTKQVSDILISWSPKSDCYLKVSER